MGKEWGLVVGVEAQADQTILESATATLRNGGQGRILNGQYPSKNSFNPRMK